MRRPKRTIVTRADRTAIQADRTADSWAAAVLRTEESTFLVRTHLIPIRDRTILRGLMAATIARIAAASVTIARGSASASEVVITGVTTTIISLRCQAAFPGKQWERRETTNLDIVPHRKREAPKGSWGGILPIASSRDPVFDIAFVFVIAFVHFQLAHLAIKV